MIANDTTVMKFASVENGAKYFKFRTYSQRWKSDSMKMIVSFINCIAKLTQLIRTNGNKMININKRTLYSSPV